MQGICYSTYVYLYAYIKDTHMFIYINTRYMCVYICIYIYIIYPKIKTSFNI